MLSSTQEVVYLPLDISIIIIAIIIVIISFIIIQLQQQIIVVYSSMCYHLLELVLCFNNYDNITPEGAQGNIVLPLGQGEATERADESRGLAFLNHTSLQ